MGIQSDYSAKRKIPEDYKKSRVHPSKPTHPCKYQMYIDCDCECYSKVNACRRCGWNPDVTATRVERIRHRHGY